MPLSLLRGYVSMELCVTVPIILQVRLSLPVRNQCCLPCCGWCCHLALEVRVSVCCLFCRLWLKVSVCCRSVVEGLCCLFCWSVCGWRSLSVVCSVGLSVVEGLCCLFCCLGLSAICHLSLSGTVGQFVILMHAVLCVCLWFAVPVCLGSWDCLCFWFFLLCVFVSDWGWHVWNNLSLLKVVQQESVCDCYHFHRQAEAKLKRSVGSCSFLALYWRDRTSLTQPVSSRLWWLQPAGCRTSTCSNRATANWTSWRHTTHSEPTSLRPGRHLCQGSFCESDVGEDYYSDRDVSCMCFSHYRGVTCVGVFSVVLVVAFLS